MNFRYEIFKKATNIKDIANSEEYLILWIKKSWQNFYNSLSENEKAHYFFKQSCPLVEGHIAFNRWLANKYNIPLPSMDEERQTVLSLNNYNNNVWNVSIKEKNGLIKIYYKFNLK